MSASFPGIARSWGRSLLVVIKEILRMYIYTQTISVSNIVAKNGLKIAACFMFGSIEIVSILRVKTDRG